MHNIPRGCGLFLSVVRLRVQSVQQMGTHGTATEDQQEETGKDNGEDVSFLCWDKLM